MAETQRELEDFNQELGDGETTKTVVLTVDGEDEEMDDEYGTIGGAGSPYEPRWPYRNLGNSDIFASFAMQCGLNEYAPEGKPMHEVSCQPQVASLREEPFINRFPDADSC